MFETQNPKLEFWNPPKQSSDTTGPLTILAPTVKHNTNICQKLRCNNKYVKLNEKQQSNHRKIGNSYKFRICKCGILQKSKHAIQDDKNRLSRFSAHNSLEQVTKSQRKCSESATKSNERRLTMALDNSLWHLTDTSIMISTKIHDQIIHAEKNAKTSAP